MQKFDSINVIPFIDIMLVLLAIVLTTATFVTTGNLDIDLPTSSSKASSDNIEKVDIAVNRDGVLFINGIENNIETAEIQLQQLAPDTHILLSIDESVEFKQFVSVVDVLQRLSLDKVSIQTRKNN